jgi:hypothetical protein
MKRIRTLSAALPLAPDRRNGEGEPLPDLKSFIDGDSRPTFIVAVNSSSPLPFELLLCNEAFFGTGLKDDVLSVTNSAAHFRAWCQSVMHWREQLEFAGRSWTAFKIQGRWKCICASVVVSHTPQSTAARTESPLNLDADNISIADARLASLYKMMEMSDVGRWHFLYPFLLVTHRSLFKCDVLSLLPGAPTIHSVVA